MFTTGYGHIEHDIKLLLGHYSSHMTQTGGCHQKWNQPRPHPLASRGTSYPKSAGRSFRLAKRACDQPNSWTGRQVLSLR